jgi:1-acyl-sn-glycerol-3-phosphate acyltransferase
MPHYRWATFVALSVLWTLLFAVPIPVMSRLSDRAVRRCSRLWARGLLALLGSIVGLRHTVRGRAHLPNAPSIILSNHQSAWETIAALLLFPDVAIVAKKELLGIPVIGWYIRRSPMIVIDRSKGVSAARHMAVEGRRALQAGRSVLIFPEGTRKSASEAIKFRRGAELIRDTGVPVVPMVIDSGRFWRSGAAAGPGTITVSILETAPVHHNAAETFLWAESRMETERCSIARTTMRLRRKECACECDVRGACPPPSSDRRVDPEASSHAS